MLLVDPPFGTRDNPSVLVILRHNQGDIALSLRPSKAPGRHSKLHATLYRLLHCPSIPGLSVSFGVHFALLLALLLIAIPQAVYQAITIESQWDASDVVTLESFSLESVLILPGNLPRDPTLIPPAPVFSSKESDPPVKLVDDVPWLRHQPTPTDPVVNDAEEILSNPPNGAQVPKKIDSDHIRRAESVDHTVNQLVNQIRTQLDEGDLRIVWLFDASISLVEDRQQVAASLRSRLDQIEQAKRQSRHRLWMGAMAFGKKTKLLHRMTRETAPMISALREAPVDPSGIENVFTAIQTAVNKYGHPSQKLMIVVWTDESGDDGAKLEAAINLCRHQNAMVQVVGASSLFGRQKSSLVWNDPRTREPIRLEIRRGPESSAIQRIQLPYWHTSNSDEPEVDPLTDDVDWQRRNQLEDLVAGFGPYGLTRLALATGGSYTVYDGLGQRSPYRLEDLLDYAPDYRSASQIAADLAQFPLRRTVMESVERSAELAHDAMPPLWLAPDSSTAFRRWLKHECRQRIRQCEQSIQRIDHALAPLELDAISEIYQAEPSPRWRAWYDLTKGRLLVVRARFREYQAVAQQCLELIENRRLDPAARAIELTPSATLHCQPEDRADLEKGVQLLTRCVTDYSDTPWADLAAREIEHPVGLVVMQRLTDQR